MADWIHCNKCGLQHGNQNPMYLVECGHLFCQRCVEKIRSTKRCSICNKAGNVILLNKKVEPNVLDFFLPFENLLSKTMEVYKFQLKHRDSLCSLLYEKYNHAKKAYISCHNANKHLMKENQMLRAKLQFGGKTPPNFSTSTPMSQSSGNASRLSSIPPRMYTTPTPAVGGHRPYHGHAMRHNLLNSGSSHGPSPLQRVPAIHHSGAMGELRRGGKF